MKEPSVGSVMRHFSWQMKNYTTLTGWAWSWLKYDGLVQSNIDINQKNASENMKS